MAYPDYVKKLKPKGSVAKKSGDRYLIYSATSKRVPGKKNPVQVLGAQIGYVDNHGYHPCERAMADFSAPVVRECGFTDFMIAVVEPAYLVQNSSWGKAKASDVFRSVVAILSPMSYLADTARYDSEGLAAIGVSVSRQARSIMAMAEASEDDLELMKYACYVRLGERVIRGEATPAVEAAMRRAYGSR